MIDLANVSFRYENGEGDAGVSGIDLHVGAGEVVVLTGGSGCGKTTLTRIVNGLIPHFHSGALTGSVQVAGRDVSTDSLAESARIIGSVFQNPRSQFFTTSVRSELAFAAENLGLDVDEILQRLDYVATSVKLESLLDRSLFTLSGGQKQKVACGSVWVPEPDVLVLDEPSSNLDAETIEDLRLLVSQWKAQGRTVLVAEHRLYYLQGIADRWLVMDHGTISHEFSATEMSQLSAAAAAHKGLRSPRTPTVSTEPGTTVDSEIVELVGFTRTYRDAPRPAVNVDRLVLPRHGAVAITGNNGAGKTTLIRGLVGLDRDAQGILFIDGARWDARRRLAASYMVMQDVNHQLFAESVTDEVTMTDPSLTPGAVESILDGLDLLDVAERHPMSLSGGQKQRVAIAAAQASDTAIVVFDEPTSGLDLEHMREVAARIQDLVDAGRLVIVVTHDRELINSCCTHLVRLEDGCPTEPIAHRVVVPA